MRDPIPGVMALADLRALLPMVRHHVAMLSSPATAGQNANAGMELADLAGIMATLCAECDIADCAELLDALHAALAEEPVAARWSPRFAAAALEAFGYALHRIGAQGIETSPLVSVNGKMAMATRLTHALTEARQPEGDEAARESQALPAAWSDDRVRVELAEAFADDDPVVPDDTFESFAEPADLTDDERAMLAAFQSAPLRVTMPPALGPVSTAPDGPDTSQSPIVHADSGWAPGPADVLLDEALPPQEPLQEPRRAAAEQTVWQIPTAQELDEIPEEMKRLFLVETEEDLQSLRLTLLRYEQQPGDPGALQAMGRIAHKIKGTAATLGFDVLAAVTHHYEDLVKALVTQRVAAGSQANAALLHGLVLLQASLDASNAGAAPDAALISEAAELLQGLAGSDGSANITRSRTTPATGALGAVMPPASSLVRESIPPVPRGDEGEPSLHVDVRRMDELMRHLSALSINRAALIQTRDDVVRLQAEMDAALTRLNDLSVQLADLQPLLRQMPDTVAIRSERYANYGDSAAGFRVADHKEHGGAVASGRLGFSTGAAGPTWDALELDQFTEYGSALQALNEVVADVSATNRELRAALLRLSQVSEDQAGLASRMQRDVMHVRLVPLSNIVPRLEFEVKVLSGMTNTSVAFSVSGEMTEIDRNISEALREPLLQLVRNAVIHGIESPEERAEAGKAEGGTVWVHAYYVGSEVIIEVGDDGRGVNPHKLAASAFHLGLLDSETARTLSPAEALDLMFLPGVTTFDKAKAVSGRGIGLDEVRTAIQKLKGAISVRSDPGKGSIFRIRVPISLSIVHALRVVADDQGFAVPFASVKRTLSLSASEILTSVPVLSDAGRGERATRTSQRIRIEREEVPTNLGAAGQMYDEIPVFALASLLSLTYEPRDPQPALLVEAGRQRVALLVDGIFEEQEVAVQALPRPLQRRAVRGASVTADGQVLLLLDLPELTASALDGDRPLPTPRPRVVPRFAETLAPRVLVVDDSVTIRQTLEHTLRRGGFEVQVARDGIEALEMMRESLPRVVVLDIEMPRLDGFEVLSILRDSPQLNGVRVVMLTSRAAEKHKEHAFKLGAQAYLIKPCPQETLIDTVRGLLAEPPMGLR